MLRLNLICACAMALLMCGSLRADDPFEDNQEGQPIETSRRILIMQKDGDAVDAVLNFQAFPDGNNPFGNFPVPRIDKERLMIGAQLRALQPGVHGLIGIDEGMGVFVHHVVQDGPAQKAGMLDRDLILDINGSPVGTPEEVIEAISQSKGKEIAVKLRRGQENLELKLTPKKAEKVLTGENSPFENGNIQIQQGSSIELDINGKKYTGKEALEQLKKNPELAPNFVLPGVQFKDFGEIEVVGPGVMIPPLRDPSGFNHSGAKMNQLEKEVKELRKQHEETMKALEKLMKKLDEK